MGYTGTMEFILKTYESLDNLFHTSLYVTGIDPSTVHNCWDTEVEGQSYLKTPGMKGKWYSTKEESIKKLKSFVRKEVKSLGGHGDLRPSQVRRLDILKEFLNG